MEPSTDSGADLFMAQPLALRCVALVKLFGDVTAVNGLDLEVYTGECFGLLGPNGAGKTTTVEILEGLTAPTSGTVEVLGCVWGKGADRDLRERILPLSVHPWRLSCVASTSHISLRVDCCRPHRAAHYDAGLLEKKGYSHQHNVSGQEYK